MSLAIRFQSLPEELENRVKMALQAVVERKLTDVQAAAFFFKFFFQRLEPMYKDTPDIAKAIKAGVQNQLVGLIVPKLIDVTMQINNISDLQFTNGVLFKTPSMTFNDIQVVADIILAHITLPEALMAKKLKVKKLANILQWLAPIATIQTEEMLQKVRDDELRILNNLLIEIGY